MRVSSVCWLLLASVAGAAEYRPVSERATLRSFVLTAGPSGWVSFEAVKRDGTGFAVHVQGTSRYLLQEGTGPVREFRHPVSGAAVRPSLGGWAQVFPTVEAPTLTVLGHEYRRVGERDIAPPAGATETVYLQPDLLVGPAHNKRQKDETRRYDTSEYEYVRMDEGDFRLMADAGVSCVFVDAEQVAWAERLGLFYWGTTSLPYPEMFYRPQYMGPVIFLDEPAVGTRDHVLRPRMEKDAAFRRAVSPKVAMEAFAEHFAESAKRNSSALMKQLRARKDIDLGNLDFAQGNLYSWETMEASASYELSRDKTVPAAFVWEPAGRVGTWRTVPELNISYGTRFPIRQDVLPSIVFGFLRGAARATGKEWGISIYGAVERADAPYWMTRAYDDGATRFHFWDNYQLACVPFGEVLAHARVLKAHAKAHPRLAPVPWGLAAAPRAELAIVIPAGYNLGHVHMGKGLLWGLPEMHRERANGAGGTYGSVMGAALAEMEKAIRDGVRFDVLWDLPGVEPKGYARVVRIGENASAPARRGEGPAVSVTISGGAGGWYTGRAESRGDLYYTTGADATGVYRNARFYWEVYGPEEEDMRIIPPSETVRFHLTRPGKYRARVGAVDREGRSTVEWREITVSGK